MPSFAPGELALGAHNNTDTPALSGIRARLYHPVVTPQASLLEANFHPIDLCLASHEIAEQVDDIVDLAYCSRYSSRPPPSAPCRGGEPELPPAETPAQPTMSTERGLSGTSRRFALCTILGDSPVVLLTMRMAMGNHMELLEFFSLPNALWPHESMGVGQVRSAEVGRVAFHPVLDERASDPIELRQRLRAYRALAFRELWVFSLRTVRQQGCRCLYAIMAPHAAKYFAAVGVSMRRIAGATLVDSEHVRRLQRTFPRYWRPEGPTALRPVPYSLKWELDPLRVNGDPVPTARTTPLVEPLSL
jgi:hypothetical protein